MPRVTAVIFDAYGTLLDVHAAMARHAARLGPHWQTVSADWRTKQIEYTWVRSLAGPDHHRDFWRLTEEALAWTAARHRITDAALLADVLLRLSRARRLSRSAGVLPRLGGMGIAPRHPVQRRAGHAGRRRARRRASTSAWMLSSASRRSACSSRTRGSIALRRIASAASPATMAFVSSNPWDAFGAASFGFQVFWVNRSGAPAEYDLRTAATELTDLATLPDLLA